MAISKGGKRAYSRCRSLADWPPGSAFHPLLSLRIATAADPGGLSTDDPLRTFGFACPCSLICRRRETWRGVCDRISLATGWPCAPDWRRRLPGHGPTGRSFLSLSRPLSAPAQGGRRSRCGWAGSDRSHTAHPGDSRIGFGRRNGRGGCGRGRAIGRCLARPGDKRSIQDIAFRESAPRQQMARCSESLRPRPGWGRELEEGPRLRRRNCAPSREGRTFARPLQAISFLCALLLRTARPSRPPRQDGNRSGIAPRRSGCVPSTGAELD